MFSHNTSDKKSFHEICEIGGAEPEAIMTQLKEFIDIVTAENGWDQFADASTEAKMLYILKCMENNDYFTFEMLEFMQTVILSNLLEGPDSPLSIPSLEGYSIPVRALAGISMNLTCEAEREKEELCEENNGPFDFGPVIVYMTGPSEENRGNVDDYNTNVVPLFTEEGKDPILSVRETLIHCYATWGEPLVVSLVSDTYMREVSEYSETARDQNLGEDFHMRPDSDVFQALACITYGFDEPFVTASSCYSYSDTGMPEFFNRSFEVIDADEMAQDKSDRGSIATEIRNFFHNVRVTDI
jgi:hypothetical protein